MIIRQVDINKAFPDGLQLQLEDDASVLDIIKTADQLIKERCGQFPVRGYRSLLQMVYHPYENRFYNQVAIQAYTRSNFFVDARGKPRFPVPDKTTVVLVPEGGCATDWEEPLK